MPFGSVLTQRKRQDQLGLKESVQKMGMLHPRYPLDLQGLVLLAVLALVLVLSMLATMTSLAGRARLRQLGRARSRKLAHTCSLHSSNISQFLGRARSLTHTS